MAVARWLSRQIVKAVWPSSGSPFRVHCSGWPTTTTSDNSGRWNRQLRICSCQPLIWQRQLSSIPLSSPAKRRRRQHQRLQKQQQQQQTNAGQRGRGRGQLSPTPTLRSLGLLAWKRYEDWLELRWPRLYKIHRRFTDGAKAVWVDLKCYSKLQYRLRMKGARIEQLTPEELLTYLQVGPRELLKMATLFAVLLLPLALVPMASLMLLSPRYFLTRHFWTEEEKRRVWQSRFESRRRKHFQFISSSLSRLQRDDGDSSKIRPNEPLSFGNLIELAHSRWHAIHCALDRLPLMHKFHLCRAHGLLFLPGCMKRLERRAVAVALLDKSLADSISKAGVPATQSEMLFTQMQLRCLEASSNTNWEGWAETMKSWTAATKVCAEPWFILHAPILLQCSNQLLNDALTESGFVVPTEVQREGISVALAGRDVLGAAKTGSGKTLAFIIPVLEQLWREKWSRFDGLGALIISPTRELALQTFEVLKKVGSGHDFSAALLIGGTDVEFEKLRISGVNIVVCTPGRLLQHMDENPNFVADSLKILVVDEADRILDMGFSSQIKAILENLPDERQTLLYSATQTKSVKSLARLSLKDPIYVSVHERSEFSTPDQLIQRYVTCPDEGKANMLWSFLVNHKHKKTLVFMSSCKQVRFMHEAFRHLRPGLSVLALHGKMSQSRRTDVYEKFCRKEHAALFATDIAARGLDFPRVDWVLQLDCPADADEYIHRSGRTARFDRKGEALLVLTPTQTEPMMALLKQRKIPISEISINSTMLDDVSKRLENICIKFPELKAYAKECFVSYLRSIHVMRNKAVFDVNKVDIAKLTRSLGLAVVPRLRFLRRHGCNKIRPTESLASNNPSGANSEKPSETGSSHSDNDEGEIEQNPDDNFLTVVKEDVFRVRDDADGRPNRSVEPPTFGDATAASKALSKAKIARLMVKKGIRPNKKVVFSEHDADQQGGQTTQGLGFESTSGGLDLELAARDMRRADEVDRKDYAEKLKARRQERKRKLKERELLIGENADEDEVDEKLVKLGKGREEHLMQSHQGANHVGDADYLKQTEHIALSLL